MTSVTSGTPGPGAASAEPADATAAPVARAGTLDRTSPGEERGSGATTVLFGSTLAALIAAGFALRTLRK
ncbi:hypothetical protein [Luteipulveratus halotolerans]|uniref:Uncharacterized protein n=1 Tax=Luteipulveratus halotolerans TaxID=1631356 RepID=A0A0L6CFX6_9MICO|nr:hypothetical protein [Luteipulveratus halotolerans]KNX36702.1 hypothetical protein VV01_05305 [Luteipulveratus halotolerans]